MKARAKDALLLSGACLSIAGLGTLSWQALAWLIGGPDLNGEPSPNSAQTLAFLVGMALGGTLGGFIWTWFIVKMGWVTRKDAWPWAE